MNREALFNEIRRKKSFLCIGLDTEIGKIPDHLKTYSDPVFEFNRAIIDATAQLCIAYKPNLAFYESMGAAGWESLEKTAEYCKRKYPEIFLIADAKRGDIGNTARMYAEAFFGRMGFDAVTVSPYMGSDSVRPFLGFSEKWAIILALTSNEGALDFQFIRGEDEHTLFEKVMILSKLWGDESKIMFVVGATKAEWIERIRQIVPHHFLLVPGIGAQGGSLHDVARFGMNSQCGLLVNSSRGIIYAGSGWDFADKASIAASLVQQEMSQLLDQYLPFRR